MPVRNEDGQIIKPGTVDLSFLPEKYVNRINDIFNAYFGLGAKMSNTVMEGKYTPSFPKDVASLTSPELGNILGHYTAWFSYLSDKRKYVSVALTFMEGELNTAKDSELGAMLTDKGNVDIKTAAAKSSTGYLMILSYVQKLRGLKTLLDADLENYDKCISTLSRDITRRELNGGF